MELQAIPLRSQLGDHLPLLPPLIESAVFKSKQLPPNRFESQSTLLGVIVSGRSEVSIATASPAASVSLLRLCSVARNCCLSPLSCFSFSCSFLVCSCSFLPMSLHAPLAGGCRTDTDGTLGGTSPAEICFFATWHLKQ